MEEYLRGLDIPHLARLEDQLERSESAIEEEVERIQVQMNVREKIVQFIRMAQKHKTATLDSLRTEIGLKMQYFEKLQSLKLESKESQNEKEEASKENAQLKEALVQMRKKKELFKALARKL